MGHSALNNKHRVSCLYNFAYHFSLENYNLLFLQTIPGKIGKSSYRLANCAIGFNHVFLLISGNTGPGRESKAEPKQARQGIRKYKELRNKIAWFNESSQRANDLL